MRCCPLCNRELPEHDPECRTVIAKKQRRRERLRRLLGHQRPVRQVRHLQNWRSFQEHPTVERGL